MGFPGWPHVIAGKDKKGLNISIDNSLLIEYIMENTHGEPNCKLLF